MQVDFKKANFKTGYVVFQRNRLCRTGMFKGDDGTFAIITRSLDRDTLKTTTLRSFFTGDSMKTIIYLYLDHFLEEVE